MMTKKERFLYAMNKAKPDCVPVTPDISNMIPCKLTRKPFWDIYLYNDPPLWQAYIDAARYFDIDPWHCSYGLIRLKPANHWDRTEKIVSKSSDRIVVAETWKTPKGNVSRETSYLVGDPPTYTSKPIKKATFKGDLDTWLYIQQCGEEVDDSEMLEQRIAIGDEEAFGIAVELPGFHKWINDVQGELETIIEIMMTSPELLDRWRQFQHDQIIAAVTKAIEYKPDYVLFGASGAFTLASPDLFRKYTLPTLQEGTKLLKEAAIPSMLHTCGKSKGLVKICVEETDLDCINPLEVPPMGDCDLSELRNLYGNKIALMGNLHTTEIMLYGTPEKVEDAAKKAIDDAGKDGAFILSTGDQCGRDTPEENIHKMVEVARTYGKY
ncbi:MAG TPA: uroporphyrinogen decarboxylase family protein [Sedimentisphaerales bacterium]|nr:uroporphyrinogen decarboxylase family protein [Sedimentisphaerales bacterium]